MPINFVQSPVKIGTTVVYANSASISISNPRRGVKSLGNLGFTEQILDGPMVGSISVSYYITDNNSAMTDLFGPDLSPAAAIQTFTVNIGEFECLTAVMDSVVLNIEPNTVIRCDVSMSFYGGYSAGNTPPTAPSVPGGFDGLMHGGKSTITTQDGAVNLVWNTDIVSCTYTMTQAVNPVYLLGDLEPNGFSIEETTVTTALAGIGFGHILDFTAVCEGYVRGDITLAGICADTSTSIAYKGNVINPEVTLAPNMEINGSLTIFDVTYHSDPPT